MNNPITAEALAAAPLRALPTVAEVAALDERGQAEHVQSLTLTEATAFGQLVRRDLERHREAIDARVALLDRIADLLHGAAEAINP